MKFHRPLLAVLFAIVITGGVARAQIGVYAGFSGAAVSGALLTIGAEGYRIGVQRRRPEAKPGPVPDDPVRPAAGRRPVERDP